MGNAQIAKLYESTANRENFQKSESRHDSITREENAWKALPPHVSPAFQEFRETEYKASFDPHYWALPPWINKFCDRIPALAHNYSDLEYRGTEIELGTFVFRR